MGLLPITIFLLLIFITKPSSAQNSSRYDDYYPLRNYPVAKEGCESLCGNVSIPYPFGMGPARCYLDEKFAIECRSSNSIGGGGGNDASSTPKPFLKLNNLELEVLGFPLRYDSNLLRVNIPEITRNCPTSRGGWNSSTSIDLRGSPFFFSDWSIFISIGCNNLARMMYVNGQTKKDSSSRSTSIIAECVSICDKSDRDSMCFGINCCQTNIGDESLQVFTANLSRADQNINNNITGPCSRGFLVDELWFMSNMTDPLAVFENMTRVPAVLDWRLLNGTTHKLGINKNRGVECYDYTYMDAGGYPYRQCECWLGYEGNPYLPNGCIGVDAISKEKFKTLRTKFIELQ